MMDRRSFLQVSGRAALLGGVSLATVGFAPPARRGEIGRRVPGVLGDVYGRFGAPRGTALSLTGDTATSRMVTWLTTGDQEVASRVRFGVVPPWAEPGDVRRGRYLDREVSGASHLAPFGTFDPDRGTVTGPADGEHPVRVHRAALTHLPPTERIAYQVGSPEGGWSDVRVFDPLPSTRPLRFTHLGDHGTTVAARRSTDAILARRPDAHLIAGDITYANGTQPIWDLWSAQVEPLAATVPLVVAPGNHEAKDHLGATYHQRLGVEDPSRPWYSFDLGPVHIASHTAGAFLTEHDPDSARRLVTDELVWLERDLADAAARRAAGELDFLVVTQHYPLYTDHRSRGPFSPQLVAAQEQILQRYQVDLLLVGHDHMYQRSHPMAYGAPTGAGPGGPGYVQVIAGAGGKSLYEFTPIATTDVAVDPEVPYQRRGLWSAASSRRFSFVEYTAGDGVIEAVAYGWDDVPGQDDVPPTEGYDQRLVRVDPDAVDPAAEPVELDRFTIRRKTPRVLRDVPTATRTAALLTRGLPEATGVVVANPAEDCTRHHH
jgi:acid phosphatase type 7